MTYWRLARLDWQGEYRGREETIGFTLRTWSADHARILANTLRGAEGPIWDDPAKVECVPVNAYNERNR